MLSRLIALILVSLCSTGMLADVEKAIIHEVVRRGNWRKQELKPTKAVQRAINHLYRTLDKWAKESRP